MMSDPLSEAVLTQIEAVLDHGPSTGYAVGAARRLIDALRTSEARVAELNAMYEEAAVAINGLRARVAELETLNARLIKDIKTATEHSFAEGVKTGCEEVSMAAARMSEALERLMDPIWPQSVIEIARTALSTPSPEKAEA